MSTPRNTEIEDRIKGLSNELKREALSGAGHLYKSNLTVGQRENVRFLIAQILKDDLNQGIRRSVAETLKELEFMRHPEHPTHHKGLVLGIGLIDDDNAGAFRAALESLISVSPDMTPASRSRILKAAIHKFVHVNPKHREDVAAHISDLVINWFESGVEPLPEADQKLLYEHYIRCIQESVRVDLTEDDANRSAFIVEKATKALGQMMLLSPKYAGEYLSSFAVFIGLDPDEGTGHSQLSPKADKKFAENLAQASGHIALTILRIKELDPEQFEIDCELLEEIIKALANDSDHIYVQKKLAENLDFIERVLPETGDTVHKIKTEFAGYANRKINAGLDEGKDTFSKAALTRVAEFLPR